MEGAMPRKSAASRAVSLTPTDKRTPAPADLPAPARKVWKIVVDSLPPGHFQPGDLLLLRALCLAEHQKAQADEMVQRDGLLLDGKAHPAAKLSAQLAGVLASLAGKLRLSMSSRVRPESAGLRNAVTGQRTGRKPWETDHHQQEDEDDAEPHQKSPRH
jgi:P27 family predicted phage terminase small subunit